MIKEIPTPEKLEGVKITFEQFPNFIRIGGGSDEDRALALRRIVEKYNPNGLAGIEGQDGFLEEYKGNKDNWGILGSGWDVKGGVFSCRQRGGSKR